MVEDSRPRLSSDFHVLRRVLVYGTIGGVLIAALKFVEYKHFVHAYPAEIYGGVIALLFAAVGIYVGLRWTRPKLPLPDREKLKDLGITQREHEILRLIAEGLSNREIGERLFVSENTVKTHSSRLFDKMDVSRRTQAVQRGRDLGLLP